MVFRSLWRVVAILTAIWCLIMLYMSIEFFRSNDLAESHVLKLSKLMTEMNALRLENDELSKMANELKMLKAVEEQGSEKDSFQLKKLRLELFTAKETIKNLMQSSLAKIESSDAPVDLAHEYLRRKIENGVTEQWYYLRSELSKLRQQNNGNVNLQQHLDRVLENGADHKWTILNDLHNLSLTNNAQQWRVKEAKELDEIVQQRILRLQNPPNCGSAKKLVCNMGKGCGYGCQFHHLVYCFMVAYGTQRTLILESHGWRYATGGWETVFLPLSDTCTDAGGSRVPWSSADSRNADIVDLPIVDSLHPRPPFLPLAVPEDLAPRLLRLHGHPAVWWVGQFVKYLLRPQPQLQQQMNHFHEKLQFQGPIVGIHVRRTDKVGTEAAFHGIEEYMVHAIEYFNILQKRTKVDKRRIYLASDEPTVLTDAQSKYPDYVFLSESHFSQSASLSSRYSDASLLGVILDIHFLSLCDYLVCTFSSQVCRVAYEIMQSLHPDAANRFHSLDDIYYFGGQNAHNQLVVQAHTPQSSAEIDMMPGDLIGVAGNHWDGYSKGTNRRTGKTGLYPSYKVVDHSDIVRYPIY